MLPSEQTLVFSAISALEPKYGTKVVESLVELFQATVALSDADLEDEHDARNATLAAATTAFLVGLLHGHPAGNRENADAH